MRDLPDIICCCVGRQESLRLHLRQNPSSSRAAKTVKATIISSPITKNMMFIAPASQKLSLFEILSIVYHKQRF